MGNDLSLTKKQTLADIATEAMAIEMALMNQESDFSMEVEAYIIAVEANLATKVDHYKFAMDRFQGSAKLLKERAEEFTRAAKALENISQRLKDRIKEVMLMLDRDEIHGRNYRFKLSPMPDKIVIHEARLSPAYTRQVLTTEPDKEMIKSLIKRGEKIAGVTTEPVHALRITVSKE